MSNILFRFKNIPCPSTFGIFDEADRTTIQTWEINPGDSEITVDILPTWQSPYRVIRATRYFIPNSREPIERSAKKVLITGNDYHINVNRETANEEHNQKSVKELITTIYSNDALSGRQKFYVSLLALQSHFEQLTYGMLVLSGHMSKTKFNNGKAEHLIKEAFAEKNTFLQSGEIEICPGKSVFRERVTDKTRGDLDNIFQEIRKLRNIVAHRWGYQDVGCGKILEIFRKVGENIDYYTTDEDFYNKASFVFVRLYARASILENRIALLIEREAIKLEREARGYK